MVKDPITILDDTILTQVITARQSNSYKHSFGRILLIAGNQQLGGAGIMNAAGALYSGAGLVTLATDPGNFTSVHARMPEVMIADWHDANQLEELINSHSVIAIGSGLGNDSFAQNLLQNVLALLKNSTNKTLIIDGSALSMIGDEAIDLPENLPIVLTPHRGEWHKLSQLTLANQTIANNQEALWRLGSNITLVLKSSGETLPFIPTTIYPAKDFIDQPISLLSVGGPHQAVRVSGDVLVGILAAFIGQFGQKKLYKSTQAAAFAHALAADEIAKEQYIALPSRVAEFIPFLMRKYAIKK